MREGRIFIKTSSAIFHGSLCVDTDHEVMGSIFNETRTEQNRTEKKQKEALMAPATHYHLLAVAHRFCTGVPALLEEWLYSPLDMSTV